MDSSFLVMLHLQCPLCHKEEDGGKAEGEDGLPKEDLYQKAEKDFWDIIQSEKKKMPDPSQDFEKADAGKVNNHVALECSAAHHTCHYNTMQKPHNTSPYNTEQHNTSQFNTEPHNTSPYNTKHMITSFSSLLLTFLLSFHLPTLSFYAYIVL